MPQLNFLKASANLLASQSPSTSAHLLGVHNRILHDDFKSLNKHQHVTSCGACGSIRGSECTKTLRMTRKPRTNRRDRLQPSVGSAEITVYKCLRCHRKTVRQHQKDAARKNSSSQTTTPSSPLNFTADPTTENKVVPAASNTSQATKATENASSKKRAKARKQSGLQALLASKQRSQEAPSSSLDIFDFLQQ